MNYFWTALICFVAGFCVGYGLRGLVGRELRAANELATKELNAVKSELAKLKAHL